MSVAHGSDICYCGDYRSQHKYGLDGKACFCVSYLEPMGGCTGFKWGRKTDAIERAHWEQYHGKAAGREPSGSSAGQA